MNKTNPEALLAQILPLLTNPKAFEAFLNQAPLTGPEKDTLRQIYRQITNSQSTIDAPASLNQLLQNLMNRANPEQLQNLAPLLEQISKMPPENLKALLRMLGIKQ